MIDPDSNCWEWQRTKNQDGYGRVKVFGVLKSAHRVAYELYTGDIPFGLQVLHSCDNPSCVNPEHLWLGTIKDNNVDKSTKGRARGHAMPGTVHPSHKLTDVQVLAIYADLRSQSKIAKEYQVSSSLVGLIKNKRRWKHLF